MASARVQHADDRGGGVPDDLRIDRGILRLHVRVEVPADGDSIALRVCESGDRGGAWRTVARGAVRRARGCGDADGAGWISARASEASRRVGNWGLGRGQGTTK